MSKRASLLTQIAGVIAIIGGVYVVWGSWAVAAAAKPGAAGLLDFAAPGKGMAFADGLTSTLGHDFALPRLIATEPLVWLGFALLLVPRLYRRVAQRRTGRDPAYVGYAYVECPECRHVVSMSSKHCPLCGTQLFSPWSNASQPGLGTSGRRA